MKHHTHQGGFSTVELLVALFVAAAFLAAGYQLYITMVRNSGDARQQAQASNIARDYMRRYVATVPASCTDSTPLSTTAVTPAPTDMVNVRVTVNYRCTPGSITSLTKVETTVYYGYDNKEVTHAVFATP